MSNTARIAATAANTLTKPLNVEDVFSTYLYTGNNTSQTIDNGIDLDGEGGLMWTKARNNAYDHYLFDTERGVGKYLFSNSSAAQGDFGGSYGLYANTSGTGFAINGGGNGYNDGDTPTNYASWTFRKAPKFFDVVTYTGNGTSQTISHNLGAEVGCIMVKATSIPSNWAVWHNSFSVPTTNYLRLNSTNAVASDANYWNSTAPTSSAFSVGASATTNSSGATYVAYLFAHNDGDGEFGPTGDQDIIKCGSYTGNGSTTGPEIDLGFEPQWLLVKRAVGGTEYWQIVDNMRGVATGGNDSILYPNANVAEVSTDVVEFNATGFQPKTTSGSWNASGNTYIYIAIRRGPMAVPESATEVFAVDQDDGVGSPAFISGFPVDFNFYRNVNSAQGAFLSSRLTGDKYMQSTSTAAESSSVGFTWDYMNGFRTGPLTTDFYGWMWRRAPNFFDVVAYTGNGTAGRTVSHNLGVAPEMMWVKGRSNADNWSVYHKDLNVGSGQYLQLNVSNAAATNSNQFTTTAPTSSVFSLGSDGAVNGSGNTYIAYLFASLDGVSKVGSYTGNGTTLNIDCGFSSGARFVLIKRTDSAGGWWVYDTERGLVAGADAAINLNTTNAEFSTVDYIDPYSAGFSLTGIGGDINASGGSYIFYAIA